MGYSARSPEPGNDSLILHQGDPMRLRQLAILPLLALPTAGCINFETLVKVKADGSGTLVQTMTMNAETMEMMKAAEGDGAKLEAGKPMALEPKDIEQAKAEAAKLGEGVTFVKAEPVDTPEAKGMRAIYSFKDVTKLKVSQKPTPPGGPTPPAGGKEADETMKFGFSKAANGNSVLTVAMPDLKAGAKEPSSKAPAKASETPPEA